jgi:pimeloyl-ACP methyl ester carboxylesterase
VDTFCLIAYSLGVPCAIRYATHHPERLAGFVIGDFPAHYPALSPTWGKRAGLAAQQAIKPHVIRALQQESSEVLLWDELDTVECPVLILRGGLPDSLLTAEECEMYEQHLRQAKVTVLKDSGHVLWEPRPDEFLQVLLALLGQIDRQFCDSWRGA